MTGGANNAINSIADLYREFHRPIFRYLFRLSGSRELAEDLTQETFFQALLSIHRFQGNSKVSTWLFKIARNQYLNDKRTQLRSENLLQKVINQGLQEAFPEKYQPEKALERKLSEERLALILQNLPEQYRTVILLKEVEELSHREIAVILGKTEVSTKVLLYRAKQRFQEEYTQLGGDL